MEKEEERKSIDVGFYYKDLMQESPSFFDCRSLQEFDNCLPTPTTLQFFNNNEK